MKRKIQQKLSRKDTPAALEFEMLLNNYMREQEMDAAYKCHQSGEDYWKLSPEKREARLNSLFV